MFHLICYVPDEGRAAVKRAAFGAGAGRIGNYSECCWEVLGNGQFRPGAGSSPYTGVEGKLEISGEWRIEFMVDSENASMALEAVRKAHPYEEPVCMLIPLA